MSKLRKILYAIRIITDILFCILLIWMLPYIYQSSWQGFLFLGVSLVHIALTLWTFLGKRQIYKAVISYNSMTIFLFFYFALISFRILLDTRLQLEELYVVNLDYCKNNFFLLALILMGMFFNMFLLARIEDEKQDQQKR